jgi:hypothetical protein
MFDASYKWLDDDAVMHGLHASVSQVDHIILIVFHFVDNVNGRCFNNEWSY